MNNTEKITNTTNTQEKANAKGEKNMKKEIVKAGGAAVGTVLGQVVDGCFRKGISDNELIAKICPDGKVDGLNGMWSASQIVSADVELAAEYKKDNNCDRIVQEQIKIISEGNGMDDSRYENLERLKQSERKENKEKEDQAAAVGREKRRDIMVGGVVLSAAIGLTVTMCFASCMLVKKILR